MLHFQTVKPECLALLNEISVLQGLESFRLAGGTALSLHLGHRISIDLDFFTNELFNPEEFKIFLSSYFNDRIIFNGSNRYGVFASIDQIKVDFLYRYERFINAFFQFENVRLASLEDIGAMKIHAAANRASKKDFYDIYELLNIFTFAHLIELHTTMFPNYGLAGTLKNLSDFSDVDLDSEPSSLKGVYWEEVKVCVTTEVQKYVLGIQQKKLDTENEKEKSLRDIISKKKTKN